jgi:hypothetical protein
MGDGKAGGSAFVPVQGRQVSVRVRCSAACVVCRLVLLRERARAVLLSSSSQSSVVISAKMPRLPVSHRSS